MKKELLVRAVDVAKEKAEIIAAASSVSLKDIVNIDYSFSTVMVETRPLRMSKLCECSSKGSASYDIDINPENVNVSDNVTITWSIE